MSIYIYIYIQTCVYIILICICLHVASPVYNPIVKGRAGAGNTWHMVHARTNTYIRGSRAKARWMGSPLLRADALRLERSPCSFLQHCNCTSAAAGRTSAQRRRVAAALFASASIAFEATRDAWQGSLYTYMFANQCAYQFVNAGIVNIALLIVVRVCRNFRKQTSPN